MALQLNQLQKTLEEFSKLLTSPAIRKYCVGSFYSEFNEYLRQCPTEANWANDMLFINFDQLKKYNTISNEVFKVPEGCRSTLKNIYRKVLGDETIFSLAWELFEKHRIILHQGRSLGLNGNDWNAGSMQEVNQCLAKHPLSYREAMPYVNVLNYRQPRIPISGMYAEAFNTMILFDLKDCDTMIHEFGHAWDFQNKYPMNDSLHNQWKALGGFRLYPFTKPYGYDVDLGGIDLSVEKNFVSSYARTTPFEDFAETIQFAITLPSTTQEKVPTKWNFLKQNVFKN